MPQTERYNVYDEFAATYDRYWGAMFCDDSRAGFQGHLLPLLPPKARVLDLCCGTGQMAHWLSGCGFRVTGLDGSAGMIRQARLNAPQAEFVVEDARSFRMPESFEAVISTFDSLNHLPSQEDLLQVFVNVHGALVQGGLFFFDMNMDAGFRFTWNEMYSVVKPDHVFVTRAVYNPKTGIGKTTVTLFHPNGKAWRRHDLEIIEYCYPEEAIRALLARAGFSEVIAYEAHRDLGMPNGQGRLFFLTAKGGLPKTARGLEPR